MSDLLCNSRHGFAGIWFMNEEYEFVVLLAPGVDLTGKVLVVLGCLPINVRAGVFGEIRGCTNEHPSLQNCSSLFIRERKCERSLNRLPIEASRSSGMDSRMAQWARLEFAICTIVFCTVLNRRYGLGSALGVLLFVRVLFTAVLFTRRVDKSGY